MSHITHIIDQTDINNNNNSTNTLDHYIPTSAMHGLALLGNPSTPVTAHRMIINKLTEMPFVEFELALLQLVHAVVTHRCSRTEECLLSLRSLLCRLCSQSLHFGVKLLWTIEAFSPNAAKSTKSALEGLRELLEAAVVNGTEDSHSNNGSGNNNNNNNNNSNDGMSDTSSQFSSPPNIFSMPSHNNSISSHNANNNTTTPPSISNNNSFTSTTMPASLHQSSSAVLTEQEEALIHIKMGRANVLNDQRLFFQQLVGISDFLRKITDRGSRGDQLRLQLLQLSSSVLQRKVFMPFSSSGERPRWIVRILPDEAVVFSSRERAPYLLVVETVTATSNHRGGGGGHSSSSPLTSLSKKSAGGSRSNLFFEDGSNHQNDHDDNDLNTSSSFGVAEHHHQSKTSRVLHSLLPSSLTGSKNNNDDNNNNNNHSRRHSGAPSSLSRRLFHKMCGDPDVREQIQLSQIGSSSNSYHNYAKPWNPQKAQPIVVYNTTNNNNAQNNNNNNTPGRRDVNNSLSTVTSAPSSSTSQQQSGSSNSNNNNKSLMPDPWRESKNDRRNRLRESSPYSHLPGWNVEALVIKAGDDLTQEQLALQVVDLLHRVWRKHEVPVSVLPYQALSVVYDGGVIECIDDAVSIDSLKKAAGVQTLHQFFLKIYGEGTPAHSAAQRNFIESMAGYSIVCYLMQVKDRHNANLMLGRSGHLVHIDFGFMFGTSPGNMQFEKAPFKMSQELLDTMGGANSEGFRYFKILLHLAMAAVREEAHQLVQLISIIAPRSGIKCFGTSEAQAKAAVDGLKQRLGMSIGNMFQVYNNNNNNNEEGNTNNANAAAIASNNTTTMSYARQVQEDEVAVARYVRELVDGSLCNWRTTRYDQFQTWQNGII